MAFIEKNGTRFSFSVLPQGLLSHGFWTRMEIAVNNPFVTYKNVNEDVSREEMENWIFAMFRLLAGGYGTEKHLSFEKRGLAVDLYPYTNNGEEVPREERRKNNCYMTVSLLFRSKKELLGGVYSFTLERKEIETFATALREEFYSAFARFEKKRGKYLFVGVSPQGYKGCNYWYLDLKKETKAGDYVWVYMGRHNLKQIVYVDSVRYCSDDTAPADPDYARKIVGKATDIEVENWKMELKRGKNE